MTPAGRALFYHLTQSGLEDTLVLILTRAAGQGWRVMVRGTDASRLEALDKRLWLAGGPEAFLPHGQEGGPHDLEQPILLGRGALPAAAVGLVLIDGAEATVEEALGLHRVWVLFDGGDEAQVLQARRLWTLLTTGGMAAQYWTEQTGRWAMKVEKAAPEGSSVISTKNELE